MQMLLPIHIAAGGLAVVSGFTALPILVLFGAMFYWLWRVRARRAAAPDLHPTFV